MGAGQSVDASVCKFNKQEFNVLLEIIKDAHAVLQFYASTALIDLPPVKLPQYKEFGFEQYYNALRNNSSEEFTSLDMKGITTVYQAFNFFTNFETVYGNAVDTNERKRIARDAFNVSHATVKFWVNQLNERCQMQSLSPQQEAAYKAQKEQKQRN